jgi:selenocysteine-specific elongation factor
VAEARSQTQALVTDAHLVALGGGPSQDGTILIAGSLWSSLVERARSALQAYHRQYPLRRGAPREEVRSRLGLDAQVSPLALQRLVQDGVVVEEDTWVRLPEHRVAIGQAQRQLLDDYVRLLESEPFSPPTAEPPEADLLNCLVDEERVVKVNESVVFAAAAYQQMVDRIVEHLRAEGKITVAQVRDSLHTTRKYALALMEHLDQRRITRRVGDERVLR